MRRCLVFLCTIVALGAIPWTTSAQQTTGSIRGVITDESGAVLPGVTVTLKGRAVPGAPTTVSNETGVYRFPNLPPGTYDISAELAGFSTTRADRHPGVAGRHGRSQRPDEAEHPVRDHHGHGGVAGGGLDQHRGRHQLRSGMGGERPGSPLLVLRPDQRRAGRQRGDLDQLALAVVRVGHQREPLPDRRHRLHGATERRRLAVAEHRRDRGNPGALARRARRLRQPRWRGVQRRDPPGQQHLPRRWQLLLPGPEPHRPEHRRRSGRWPALQPRRVQGHHLAARRADPAGQVLVLRFVPVST